MSPPLPPSHRPAANASEVAPVIVIDTRERTPLAFTRFPSKRGTLTTGDYSFVGGEDHFSVERKTVADLVGCCLGENRARFERELHRLRGFAFARLLVIGSRKQIAAGKYRSQINPASVLGSISAWEVRYHVPVVFAPSEKEAAQLVEDWVWWFAREWVLSINKLVRESSAVAPADY